MILLLVMLVLGSEGARRLLDLRYLPHMSLTRRTHGFARPVDFVWYADPNVNPQSQLRFVIDIWRSVSLVHSCPRHGYQVTRQSPVGNFECIAYDGFGKMCDQIGERLTSPSMGMDVPQLWTTQVRLPNGVDGIIGGNRLGINFFRNFFVYPDDGKMKLIPNPPDLTQYVCKDGRMHFSPISADGLSKGTWQVSGRLGVVGSPYASRGEIVFSSAPSPIELDEATFAELESAIAGLGARMTRHPDFPTSYVIRGCRRVGRYFPKIFVEIGIFQALIPASEYTYTSRNLPWGACVMEVQSNKGHGVMQVNSALLRNTATWFNDTQLGICLINY